jgi:hypothetical protein
LRLLGSFTDAGFPQMLASPLFVLKSVIEFLHDPQQFVRIFGLDGCSAQPFPVLMVLLEHGTFPPKRLASMSGILPLALVVVKDAPKKKQED